MKTLNEALNKIKNMDIDDLDYIELNELYIELKQLSDFLNIKEFDAVVTKIKNINIDEFDYIDLNELYIELNEIAVA